VRIQTYINDNLAQENLTIEALVDELAMSRAQLYRKVTALTGLSPARLIRDSRLDHAHHLLRTHPDLRVNEVMDRVGMNSEHHFRTLFRERFGISPQDAKG
jgi:AraC-like DNA-binding protein